MVINLTQKLNYKIENQYERIKLVDKILEENKNYIGNYFDNNFKYSPKSGVHGDSLSYDDQICKQLEILSNYILFSPDAEKIDKKTEYNFYTENQFKDIIKKQDHIEEIVENTKVKNKYDEVDVIDFLIRKGNNFKKQINQVITKEDLKDKELKVVKEYQDYIDYLKNDLDFLRKENKNKNKQYKLVRHMSFCKTDQIYCKDSIKGTIYFKNVLPDSTDIDYDQFDFFDKEHVISLLKFDNMNLTTDLGILIYDLNKLIKRIKLSKFDKKILKYWRVDDSTQEDIAQKLDISQQHVCATLNKIADRVIKVFEFVYEDWYYLNIVKGKYKKCSKCEKIKLANERYFRKRSDDKGDGFYNYCRKCEILSKSDEN